MNNPRRDLASIQEHCKSMLEACEKSKKRFKPDSENANYWRGAKCGYQDILNIVNKKLDLKGNNK